MKSLFTKLQVVIVLLSLNFVFWGLASLGACGSQLDSQLDSQRNKGLDRGLDIQQPATQHENLGVEDCPAGYNIIVGTEGDDTIEGTSGNDCIVGLGGGDSIYGYGGDDFILGGDGGDYIDGGDGNDVIYGGSGGDWIFAGNGNDEIHGGDGGDIIDGERGNDQIFGDAGNDWLIGDKGDDLLVGGEGDDSLFAGKGDDTCVDDASGSSCEHEIDPLAVHLLSAEARLCEQGVCLHWTTGFERHNQGFVVYRQDAARWQRLNIGLIPGAGNVATPRSYEFHDREGQAGDRYFIKDVDFSGRQRRHPWFEAQPALAVDGQKTQTAPSAFRLKNRFVAEKLRRPAPFRFNAHTQRAFAFSGQGLFSISSADLAARPSWSLSQHGRPLAQFVDEQGQRLFWAQAQQNRDADHDVIVARQGASRAFEIVQTQPCAQGMSQVQVQQVVEKNLEYVVSRPFGLEQQPFVWTHAMTGHRAAVDFAAPQLVANTEAGLDLELAGASEANHQAEIWLNGELLGQAEWLGQIPQILHFDLAAGQVHAQGNHLEIVLLAEDFDYQYLNSLTLHYRRHLRADKPGFSFSAQPGQCILLRWDADESVPVLLDVSQSQQARWLALPEAQIDRAGRAWVQLKLPAFGRAQGARNYWLQSSQDLPKIVPLRFVQSMQMRRVDYLALVPPEFVAAVQPLLDWHRQQGLNVQMLTTTQIYDRFSGGQPDAAAYKKLLQAYFARFATLPRFVLLAGPASVGVSVSTAQADLVPTAFRVDDNFGFEAASDDKLLGLSDFANELRPALGRLAFRDADEAQAVVNKLLAWYAEQELTTRAGRVLNVSDKGPVTAQGQMSFAELAAMTDSLRSAAGLQNESFSFAARDDAAQDLFAALNSGTDVGVVQYFGHAFVSGWSSPQALDLLGAQSLRNAQLFALFSWSCFDGSFVGPWADSLVWELVANPLGGAYAATASASLTNPAQSAELATALWWILSREDSPGNMGEALRQAKNLIAGRHQELDQILDSFNLLGDPAAPLY